MLSCVVRRRSTVLCAIVAALVVACGGGSSGSDDASSSTSTASATTTEAVTTIEGEISTPDGRARTYRLHVPPQSGEDPPPLLLALHGGGGSPEQFERASRVAELARTAGVLVAVPGGSGGGRTGAGLQTWNAGQCCGPAASDDVDDVGFLRTLVDQLAATYGTDPSRVVVTGHSNGAAMAYRLACELGDRVLAIAVQSGPLGVDPCTPARPVSVMHIHGSQDRNVPVEGGTGSQGLSGVDWPPAARGVELLAAAAGCDAVPVESTDPGPPAVHRRSWGRCDDGARAVYVVVDGAAHAWMGTAGTGRRGDAADVGFDTTSEVWAFLEGQLADR